MSPQIQSNEKKLPYCQSTMFTEFLPGATVLLTVLLHATWYSHGKMSTPTWTTTHCPTCPILSIVLKSVFIPLSSFSPQPTSLFCGALGPVTQPTWVPTVAPFQSTHWSSYHLQSNNCPHVGSAFIGVKAAPRWVKGKKACRWRRSVPRC